MPKFSIGDYIRVESSDRSGYNYATILGIRTIGSDIYYSVAWDLSAGKTWDYKASEVDHLWELYDIGKNLSFKLDFEDECPVVDSYEKKKQLSTCDHEWTEYHGLTQSFTFCKKCDEKMKNGN